MRPGAIERAAVMPRGLWLSSVLGRYRRDYPVIRWDTEPHRLFKVPTGVRWDALILPSTVGIPLLKRLTGGPEQDDLGPVLLDARTDLTYWLMPLGSSAEISARQGLLSLRPGWHLAVSDPDHDCSPDCGPRQPVTWAHWPSINGTLTSPELLASRIPHATREAATRCFTITRVIPSCPSRVRLSTRLPRQRRIHPD
jgi:hypothetical protein